MMCPTWSMTPSPRPGSSPIPSASRWAFLPSSGSPAPSQQGDRVLNARISNDRIKREGLRATPSLDAQVEPIGCRIAGVSMVDSSASDC